MVVGQDSPTEKQIEELLDHGTVTVEVKDELIKKIQSGRQLRVKMGFDPSAPDIHLGHTIGMKKLRAFQDLGHKVVIIVGDWTAQIGDPSERSAQRRMLSAEEVRDNAHTYLDQFFKVVDSDPEKVEVRWQSSWFGSFDLADVLRLTSRFTVARMLDRDDFHNRYNAGSPIAIVEFLYPLLQAYDSVAVQSDIEMGGTDQTFNLLVGRDIQREMGQEPQDIMTVPILVGTDGKQKMSKSLGNYVGVTDEPADMYGKLMSIPDSALAEYINLAADFTESDRRELLTSLSEGQVNPRDVKDKMAMSIVATYHNADLARHAQQEFARVHRQGAVPSDMEQIEVTYPANPVELLRQSGFATSNNDARRLISQGGLRIAGERIESEDAEISFSEPVVLQAGRRRFVELVPSGGSSS